MKVYSEISLEDFDFWGNALYVTKYLESSDFRQIESIMEDTQSEWEWGETEVNDFFSYEEDTIAEWLGYSDFEELIKEREENT